MYLLLLPLPVGIFNLLPHSCSVYWQLLQLRREQRLSSSRSIPIRSKQSRQYTECGLLTVSLFFQLLLSMYVYYMCTCAALQGLSEKMNEHVANSKWKWPSCSHLADSNKIQKFCTFWELQFSFSSLIHVVNIQLVVLYLVCL